MITQLQEKIKGLAVVHGKEVFLVAVVLLTGFLGFGLGTLTKIEAGKVPVIFHDVTGAPTATSSPVASAQQSPPPTVSRQTNGGTIVASKNGTKYYTAGCSGAGRISDKNKISFASEAAAVSAGYSKAAACK